MVDIIITAICFLLPAYVANMCPVFAGALKLPLGKPINDHLFGANKTWRGFYSGYLGALGVLFLQKYWQESGILENYRLLDYAEINLFFYAFLFGIGAITGDLIKSYFKRRLDIKPGSPWFPFDQLDLVVGALVFLVPFYQLGWPHILVLIIVTPLFHFLSNLAGYLLGLKKVWW